MTDRKKGLRIAAGAVVLVGALIEAESTFAFYLEYFSPFFKVFLEFNWDIVLSLPLWIATAVFIFCRKYKAAGVAECCIAAITLFYYFKYARSISSANDILDLFENLCKLAAAIFAAIAFFKRNNASKVYFLIAAILTVATVICPFAKKSNSSVLLLGAITEMVIDASPWVLLALFFKAQHKKLPATAPQPTPQQQAACLILSPQAANSAKTLSLGGEQFQVAEKTEKQGEGQKQAGAVADNEGDAFCRYCGSRLIIGAPFCRKCGKRVSEEAVECGLPEDREQSTPGFSPAGGIQIRQEHTAPEEKEQIAPAAVPLQLTKLPPKLQRAFLFLEDAEWDRADKYLEDYLDEDPTNAAAYLGKAMHELKIKTTEELGENIDALKENRFFVKARRFAEGELKEQLDALMQGR